MWTLHGSLSLEGEDLDTSVKKLKTMIQKRTSEAVMWVCSGVGLQWCGSEVS